MELPPRNSGPALFAGPLAWNVAVLLLLLVIISGDELSSIALSQNVTLPVGHTLPGQVTNAASNVLPFDRMLDGLAPTLVVEVALLEGAMFTVTLCGPAWPYIESPL